MALFLPDAHESIYSTDNNLIKGVKCMSFFMDKISWLLDKFAGKIPQVEIPWEKFSSFMDIVNPYLSQANIIFPVDALLTILILYGTIRAILLIIWTVAFIRKLLPF